MTALISAARAVLECWDSPRWRWGSTPTADVMNAMRDALDAAEAQPAAPAGWVPVTERMPKS